MFNKRIYSLGKIEFLQSLANMLNDLLLLVVLIKVYELICNLILTSLVNFIKISISVNLIL